MKTLSPLAVCTTILFLATAARAQEEIAPAGQQLAHKLDQMDVEHRWLPGHYINWRTGESLDRPVTDGKRHTHCGAFAAVVAAELGVYLLCPPQHKTVLLGNAQYDWLSSEAGKKEGWVPVATGLESQKRANQGQLVVAVYKAIPPEIHGHIAVIRPSTKSAEKIQEEGPQIIQAGSHNYTSTSLKTGFKERFDKNLVRFFAHPLATGNKNS